jgi:NMD protein affecting ribosome stability and mRNA decay
MVHFEVCECGSTYEVDTASNQVLCDDCIKKNEDTIIQNIREEMI